MKFPSITLITLAIVIAGCSEQAKENQRGIPDRASGPERSDNSGENSSGPEMEQAGEDTLPEKRAGEEASVHYGSMAYFYRKAETRGEYHTLTITTDTTIVGRRGTRITLGPKTFVTASGAAPDGAVRLELKECYSLSDILLSNLSTTSNGQLLETGGMIYLNAVDGEGGQLRVRSGEVIRLELPTAEKLPDMETFLGERRKDGSMEWVQADNSLRSEAQVQVQGMDLARSSEGRVLRSFPLSDSDRAPRGSGLGSSPALRDPAGIVYRLETPKLGWINCDRFLSSSLSLADLAVPTDPAMQTTMSLVLRNYRSIVPGRRNGAGSVIFRDLPEGEPALIVGLALREGEPMMATEEITIGEEPPELEYRPKTLEQLRKEFADLE